MIRHAGQGEIVDVHPYDDDLSEHRTHTLFKTDQIELLRLILPKGKRLPRHRAPGPIIVQCLEGAIGVTALGYTTLLSSGQLMHLESQQAHSVVAVEDSSVLLTIVFEPGPKSVSN